MTIPQHSSVSNEHYTPSHVVEAARGLLGAFDLDPASCMVANKTVKAERIFTIEDDGLYQPWGGRVFLNPPGGRLKEVDGRLVPVQKGPGLSSMLVWWDKLTTEWESGAVDQAFFVGFTLEILRLSQRCIRPVQDFPRCYPAERLHFVGADPTHANVLVYLPPRGGEEGSGERLASFFSGIGLCEGGRP